MAKYKMGKKQRLHKIKKGFIFVLIMLCVGVFSICLYRIYDSIEVVPHDNSYAAQSLVHNVQENQVNVAEADTSTILEKVNESIVGISKLKNTGSTIFLKEGSKQLGLGTGFIVTEDGYIVTNEHVSGSKYSTCYVTLENGRNYTADVVWSDSNIDLSIIKINANKLSYVTLGNSDQMKIGNKVYAIGNPIGFEFQRTVTSGIISGLDRTIKIEEEGKSSYMEDLIQTDATINPGNSGGPLINYSGEVIGINSVKIETAEGIGFAIPINVVKPIIEQIKKNGKFEETQLGVFAYDKKVLPYIYQELGIKQTLDSGIYVTQVVKGSAADKAGIQEGDILVRIDQVELNRMCDLRCYIYTKKPKEKVTLLINRKGINQSMVITLDMKI